MLQTGGARCSRELALVRDCNVERSSVRSDKRITALLPPHHRAACSAREGQIIIVKPVGLELNVKAEGVRSRCGIGVVEIGWRAVVEFNSVLR